MKIVSGNLPSLAVAIECLGSLGERFFGAVLFSGFGLKQKK